MIRSFKCEYTEALSKGHHVKKFVNIAKVARRKLRQLEIANQLNEKGYSTRRGSRWYAATVKRIVQNARYAEVA